MAIANFSTTTLSLGSTLEAIKALGTLVHRLPGRHRAGQLARDPVSDRPLELLMPGSVAFAFLSLPTKTMPT